MSFFLGLLPYQFVRVVTVKNTGYHQLYSWGYHKRLGGHGSLKREEKLETMKLRRDRLSFYTIPSTKRGKVTNQLSLYHATYAQQWTVKGYRRLTMMTTPVTNVKDVHSAIRTNGLRCSSRYGEQIDLARICNLSKYLVTLPTQPQVLPKSPTFYY